MALDLVVAELWAVGSAVTLGAACKTWDASGQLNKSRSARRIGVSVVAIGQFSWFHQLPLDR